MAMTTTLYRFHIELSDIERAVYDSLDFRVAQHPSEGLHYMLTRVLAFALNSQEDLAFASAGLSDPDVAAISIPDVNGGFRLQIEIGNPSAKKLHKAMKVSRFVKVYTYKNPELMMKEVRDEKIHRAEEIEFFSISPAFIEELIPLLKKDNRWDMVINEGVMTIQAGENSVSGEVLGHRPFS
ncbi:MAG: YaeQ family protein [Bacteriovoracaceae bacterium]